MNRFDSNDMKEFGIEEDVEKQFSPEEIEEFGIESDQPSSPEASKPTSSGVEAFTTGMADSASFGFLDELVGATGATGDYLATKAGVFDPSKEDVLKHMTPEMRSKVQDQINPEDFKAPDQNPLDLYKKYRDVQRNKMAMLQEENPKASLAGNLLGGFMIPGGAMAKGVTKGAGLARNLIQSGKGAAKLGGLYGLGMSEAEDLTGMAKDTAASAALGGSLGVALPLAGAGIKQIGKIPGAIGKTDIGKIFKSYSKGERLADDIPYNFNQLKDLGGDITSELSSRTSKESKMLGEFMQQATEEGKTVNSRQMISKLNEVVEDLPDSVSKNKIMKKLNNYVETNGLDESDSPIDVFKLFKDIKKNMAPSGKDLGERRVFADMDQVLKESLQEGVETLPKSYSKMSDYLSQIESLTGKAPGKFQSTKDKIRTRESLANLLLEKSPEMRHKTKLKDVMEGFTDPLRGTKQVKGLEDIAPDLAARIENEAPDIAEKIRLGMSIDPRELKTISPDLRSQIAAQFGGGIGILRKGAAVSGSGAKAVADFTRDVSESLTNASPEVLNNIVSRLAQEGSDVSKYLSQNLSSLAEKDRRGRQSVLFGIMQNPIYRKKLQEMTGEEVEDESR